jgi:hemolysin activation/secretion protein
LNINDVNKRINHINRLNSHQVNFGIKPGKKPYYSEIVIDDNKQDYQPFGVTLDNSGSKSTGVDKIKLSADWDDFLIPLSKWSLNYSFPAHAEKDKKDSNAYTLDVSFPYRDYLFNYNATKLNYITSQALKKDDTLYSFGNATTKNFYLTKYLNKTNKQDSKIKIGLSLSDEKSYSKVRGTITKSEVGSRKLSVLSLGYEHSFQLSDKSTLYLNPSISRGIDALINYFEYKTLILRLLTHL